MKITTIITLICSIIILHPLQSQDSMKKLRTAKVAIGQGTNEFTNITADYRLNNVELGMGIGTFICFNNASSSSTFSFPVSVAYFLGKNSRHQKPWYGKVSFIHTKDVYNESTVLKQGFLEFKAGREINLSKRIGASIDVGLSKELYYKVSYNSFDHYPYWSSASFKVYYRFYYE